MSMPTEPLSLHTVAKISKMTMGTRMFELAIAKRSGGTWPAIFMTCQKVYREARPVFWSSVHLVFPHNQPPAGKTLKVGLAESDMARIKSISMGVFHETFLHRFDALDSLVMEYQLLRWNLESKESFHAWNDDEALAQYVVENAPQIEILLKWLQSERNVTRQFSVHVLIKSWKFSYAVGGTMLIDEPMLINLKTRHVSRNYRPCLENLSNSDNTVSCYRWGSPFARHVGP